MSLVGNLADLGLGDILQIISLSQKSGTLQLATPTDSGAIGFVQGKVVSAVREHAEHSLADVLMEQSLVSPATFQEMLALQTTKPQSAQSQPPLLWEAFSVSIDAIESAFKKRVEQLVFDMFEWDEGNFSFVVAEDPREVSKLKLSSNVFTVMRGLNPQYLAMEGARIKDEKQRSDPFEKFMAQGKKEPAAAPKPLPPEIVPSATTLGKAPPPPPVPVAAPPAAVKEEALPAPVPAKQMRAAYEIILIDDDANMLRAFRDKLAPLVPQVTVFTKVDAGLKRMRELLWAKRAVFVVCDLILPRSDGAGILGGLEALEKIRPDFPEVPVFLLFDYPNDEAKQRAEKLNVNGIVSKPRRAELEKDKTRAVLDEPVRLLYKALEPFVMKAQAQAAAVHEEEPAPPVPEEHTERMAPIERAAEAVPSETAAQAASDEEEFEISFEDEDSQAEQDKWAVSKEPAAAAAPVVKESAPVAETDWKVARTDAGNADVLAAVSAQAGDVGREGREGEISRQGRQDRQGVGDLGKDTAAKNAAAAAQERAQNEAAAAREIAALREADGREATAIAPLPSLGSLVVPERTVIQAMPALTPGTLEKAPEKDRTQIQALPPLTPGVFEPAPQIDRTQIQPLPPLTPGMLEEPRERTVIQSLPAVTVDERTPPALEPALQSITDQGAEKLEALRAAARTAEQKEVARGKSRSIAPIQRSQPEGSPPTPVVTPPPPPDVEALPDLTDHAEEAELIELTKDLTLDLGDEFDQRPPQPNQDRALVVLKSLLFELMSPSNRDTIMLLVLRYASELFSRGTLLLVARDELWGLGGFSHQVKNAEFVALTKKLKVPIDPGSSIAHVIKTRSPQRHTLDRTANERVLATALGVDPQKECFLAPLLSADRVAAILLGDNQQVGKDVGDTHGLEIFLLQAGMAMERALLERRLKELAQKDG